MWIPGSRKEDNMVVGNAVVNFKTSAAKQSEHLFNAGTEIMVLFDMIDTGKSPQDQLYLCLICLKNLDLHRVQLRLLLVLLVVVDPLPMTEGSRKSTIAEDRRGELDLGTEIGSLHLLNALWMSLDAMYLRQPRGCG